MHIHEAERGLLETIVLLFTSIVCVPLVVKGVPGGDGTRGYGRPYDTLTKASSTPPPPLPP